MLKLVNRNHLIYQEIQPELLIFHGTASGQVRFTGIHFQQHAAEIVLETPLIRKRNSVHVAAERLIMIM